MYEDLLPIGSVVLLEGGNKRLMITGRIQARKGDKTVYDYSACLFPEGLIDPQGLYFFNRDAITTIFFIGLQDREEMEFRSEYLADLGELYVTDEGDIREVNPRQDS